MVGNVSLYILNFSMYLHFIFLEENIGAWNINPNLMTSQNSILQQKSPSQDQFS